MEVFSRLFSALNRRGIRYLVAGGVAVNLYGIERATADVDIALKMSEANLLKFVEAAKEMGLKPKMPIKLEDFLEEDKRKRWASEKGMAVFSLHDPKHPYFLLDVFVEEPFDFDEAYRRRKKVKYEGMTVAVVSLKDLIGMKEKSARPHDRADVFYLKRISKDEA